MNTPEQQIEQRPPSHAVGLGVWAVIHLLLGISILRGASSFYLLVFYVGLSWLVAVPWVGFFVKPSNAKYRLLMLWMVGPLLLYLYAKAGAAYGQHRFEQDMAYVRELCEKQGGEKIYRTVENVEGILQINLPDPDGEKALRDPNAENPWARAQGDDAYMPAYINSKDGYRFFEQQPGYKQKGPPFKRTYLHCKKAIAANLDGNEEICEPIQAELSVRNLRSRYGYLIEDLTTPEMRERWVGGGTIRIIDLETNEVLAERTGFYKGLGGAAKLHWGGGHASLTACQYAYGLPPFLKRVLQPIKGSPTAQELQPLVED